MPDPKRPLKVFLCHASADKQKVRELYRYLRRRGIKPWLDEVDLVAGQDWQVEIPKALATSDAIIICLTKNSVDKEGYIQKEIKFALDKALEMPEGRIFLIPVRFEECEVPFSLSRYQWVDLFDEAGYSRMMKALKFRASQLERAPVEVPKAGDAIPKMEAIVEENEPIAAKEAPSPINLQENLVEPAKPKIEKLESSKVKRNRNSTIIVVLIGLSGISIIGLLSLPLIERWFSPVPLVPLLTVTMTVTAVPPSETLEPSLTPTETLTSTSTPTATLTPSPTQLPIQITDEMGVIMRLIPAGGFTMGSDNGENDEKPVHQVYLDAYYMDIYEVTNALYKACVDSGECAPPRIESSYNRSPYYGSSDFENYPVLFVDWDEAEVFCKRRGGSLPTEAQWEKAARSTDGRIYPWGNDYGCHWANVSFQRNQCAGDTAEVGSYKDGKSPYGIYDLAGNVWEWTADWYSETYYQESPSINPLGPDLGEYHVLRGGSWSDSEQDTRASKRRAGHPVYLENGFNFGFRCVRSP